MAAPITTSTVTRTSTISQGPSTTTNHAHPIFPKYTDLSTTTWEAWVFDAVDQNPPATGGGAGAIEISFFRDATGLFRGREPLRVAFHAQLPGGGDDAAVHFDEHAAETVVEDLGDRIKSVWTSQRSEGDKGFSSSFEVCADLSAATLTFDLPEVRGTVTFKNVAGGSAVSAKEELFAPLTAKIGHAQPIVSAAVDVALAFTDGRELRFAGCGGVDRCVMAAPMPALLEENTYVRGHAGPWTFALLRSVDKLAPDARRNEVIRATVTRDGEVVFSGSTTRLSLTEDYVCLRAAYGGKVRGTFADRSSGFVLDFVAPGTGKHWHFDVQHDAVWWSIPLGPPPAKFGNNGFTSKVTGGEVGGEEYSGMAVVGHLQMPQMPAAKK
ncbi:uncharacterized protein LTHEOB_10364 [Lasiodiplodia theobromae]|uniref:uncharacterized protein n=1 Tax=Lasiodiplodia theobromae TaxID=45133 RepID=UPI0015C308A9|nr:uncharacterized protein LTHEOB_10364 [Lasiodiplodia theobromae]KAF4539200.1 hypothetical protein LTHEOB_10364 [Lasiodiplodia theobromae]